MMQNLLWIIFGFFTAGILYANWGSSLWAPSAGKYALWLAFAAFTAYSYYCSKHENLFASIRKIGKLHWGRQVGIDLYIGFVLFCGFIFLHQGSVGTMLLWTLPVLIYGNQATLLYLAVYYESIVTRFIA